MQCISSIQKRNLANCSSQTQFPSQSQQICEDYKLNYADRNRAQRNEPALLFKQEICNCWRRSNIQDDFACDTRPRSTNETTRDSSEPRMIRSSTATSSFISNHPLHKSKTVNLRVLHRHPKGFARYRTGQGLPDFGIARLTAIVDLDLKIIKRPFPTDGAYRMSSRGNKFEEKLRNRNIAYPR